MRIFLFRSSAGALPHDFNALLTLHKRIGLSFSPQHACHSRGSRRGPFTIHLRMVAARVRHDIPSFGRRQVNSVTCASSLERPGLLKELALEEHLPAAFLVHVLVRHNRCPMDVRRNPRCRGLYPGERDLAAGVAAIRSIHILAGPASMAAPTLPSSEAVSARDR